MRRAGQIALVALLGAIGLTGCASAAPQLDPDQAEAEVLALLVPVQALVSGEWESLDKAAEACSSGSGDGVRFGLLRIGPGVDDPALRQAFVDAVVEQWTKAGFAPSVSEHPVVNGVAVTQVRFPESGFGDDGLYLSASVSQNSAQVEGQTRCVPGDADEINGSD